MRHIERLRRITAAQQEVPQVEEPVAVPQPPIFARSVHDEEVKTEIKENKEVSEPEAETPNQPADEDAKKEEPVLVDKSKKKKPK